MRDVLFRGKRKDNGEWVVGGTIIKFNNEGDGDLFFMPQINEKCIATHDDDNNIIMFENCTFYEIIPETVGQYTGLTDKNGMKIFEGDIVAIDHTIRTTFWIEIPETHKPRRSYSCHWNEKENELLYKRNYAVEWKEKDARWILRNGSDQHNLREIFLHFHNGIIVGNIHDNPELLKGGER